MDAKARMAEGKERTHMNLKLATPALALALLATAAIAQGYGPPPPREGYGQGGWDVPPGELREVARQGFRDGIVGAQRDLENHRRPNVNNRDEYRHPHVPGNFRADYRIGFQRGYDAGIAHAFGGNGYGPPPPRPY
jgi:ribosome modulation factor